MAFDPHCVACLHLGYRTSYELLSILTLVKDPWQRGPSCGKPSDNLSFHVMSDLRSCIPGSTSATVKISQIIKDLGCRVMDLRLRV